MRNTSAVHSLDSICYSFFLKQVLNVVISSLLKTVTKNESESCFYKTFRRLLKLVKKKKEEVRELFKRKIEWWAVWL